MAVPKVVTSQGLQDFVVTGKPTATVESDSVLTHPRRMPETYEGVSIDKRPMGSRVLAIGGTGGVRVNTSREAMKIWADLPGYMKTAHAAGFYSSDHPSHIMWHELGHTLSKRNGSVDDESRLSNTNGNSNPYFKQMASQVSNYAGRNGHEFLSEVYAAKRAGKTFPKEVDEYYSTLGGPKLHAPLKVDEDG